MKRLILFLAASSLLLLTACGPRRVNLAAHRATYDYYPPLIDKMEADYQVQTQKVKEIVAATSTPKAAPYPQLNAFLKECYRVLIEMREGEKKIDAFKKRYDAWAAGKGEINSDDAASWNDFKAVQGEYDGIAAGMGNYVQRYNQAVNSIEQQQQTFNIAKTSHSAIKTEADSLAVQVTQGVKDMDEQIESRGQTLLLAGASGLNPLTAGQKALLLVQLKNQMPAAKTLAEAARQSGAKVKMPSKDATVWLGPGMSGDIGPLQELRDIAARYVAVKKNFDKVAADFDRPPATPVPAAVTQP